MHVELQMDLALLQRAMKAETEAALLRAALDAETARWEEALRQTWQMVDPLKPAGQPGSYWRGQDAGIVAALTTLRANLKTPNASPIGEIRMTTVDSRQIQETQPAAPRSRKRSDSVQVPESSGN